MAAQRRHAILISTEMQITDFFFLRHNVDVSLRPCLPRRLKPILSVSAASRWCLHPPPPRPTAREQQEQHSGAKVTPRPSVTTKHTDFEQSPSSRCDIDGFAGSRMRCAQAPDFLTPLVPDLSFDYNFCVPCVGWLFRAVMAGLERLASAHRSLDCGRLRLRLF